jgi:quercetin dioxygenase-like cupin family protein
MDFGPATKVNVADVDAAEGLREDEGWIQMRVQYLISAANSNSEEVVFGRTVFTPGSRHEAHRHANAEEIQYLVRGEGIVIDGDAQIRVVAGDVVHTEKGQWHGFINTSDTDDAELIWAWAGASSRDTAGYEARH